MSELTAVEQDAAAQLTLARTVRAVAVSVSVTTTDEYETAGRMLVLIKTRIKEIEEKRKSWVEPLNKTVKNINAFFKPAVTEWENTVEVIKIAMLAYQQIAVAEKMRAFEAAKQLALQGVVTGTGIDAVQYQQLAATAAAAAPAATGISARERWSWRVVDVTKVPREFLGIDATKVNAAVHTGKGATSIPGIEVFRDDIMAVRGA